MLKNKLIIIDAIDEAGSAAELVRRINIQVEIINEQLPDEIKIKPTYSAMINNWINRDVVGVSPQYVYAFSKATGISCHKIRPDVFIEAANDSSNQQDLA